ncbi:hypothetical protein [Cupriavidus plantarum]|uniref:hypothetical protein n=1 Tax=Cupriavidus plantarum TaxID=942865 RepID=UPI00339D5838
MEKTFECGEYTVTLNAAFDEQVPAETRVRIDIVINRTDTGEDVFTERRFFARMGGPVGLHDGIRHGENLARATIERGALG